MASDDITQELAQLALAAAAASNAAEKSQEVRNKNQAAKRVHRPAQTAKLFGTDGDATVNGQYSLKKLQTGNKATGGKGF